MNMRQPTNRPASIRQRLLNLSRDRGEDFNLTLTRYGTERLLYRLSQSERADHFVLKSTQWNAFLSRHRLDVGAMGLTQIIRRIRLFLMPPMIAAASGQEFRETWPAGGPWVATR